MMQIWGVSCDFRPYGHFFTFLLFLFNEIEIFYLSNNTYNSAVNWLKM